MVDDDRNQALHANSGTRQFGLALKLGRDDRRRWDAELFKGDGVADAARAAGTAVTDRCQHDIVVRGDLRDEFRSGVLREAVLHIVVHLGKFDGLFQRHRRRAQDLVRVPFGIVENGEPQAIERLYPGGNRNVCRLDNATWIENQQRILFCYLHQHF